jgi:hypothetical protein
VLGKALVLASRLGKAETMMATPGLGKVLMASTATTTMMATTTGLGKALLALMALRQQGWLRR